MFRIALLAMTSVAAGCTAVRSDPEKATRGYPFWLSQQETIQAQVLTDGDTMVVVNATTRDFREVDLWLNERYMLHVDRIAPGETRRFPLGGFWDSFGEGPNPGGLLRYYQPTPIRLVQIQIDDTQPLVGLVAVLPDAETR
jgi:hypothetical protein